MSIPRQKILAGVSRVTGLHFVTKSMALPLCAEAIVAMSDAIHGIWTGNSDANKISDKFDDYVRYQTIKPMSEPPAPHSEAVPCKADRLRGGICLAVIAPLSTALWAVAIAAAVSL